VLAALALGAGLLVREQVDRERLWVKVKRLYDEGTASEAAGDYARAMVQYESAARLVDRPDPPSADPQSMPASPSVLWTNLEELRQHARQRYNLAVRTGRYRDDADTLFQAADPLRFRLTG